MKLKLGCEVIEFYGIYLLKILIKPYNRINRIVEEVSMYTYEAFETDGVFTLLRPILMTFVIMGVLLFIGIILPKTINTFIHASTVISLSILSILVSAQVVFYDAIIVDELGMGGDTMATSMFMIIIVFGIVNPLVYSFQHKRLRK